MKRLQRSLKRNPKKFWKHVNCQRKESGLPSNMSFQGINASHPRDISQLFATKFSSTFSSESIPIEQVAIAANSVPQVDIGFSRIVIEEQQLLSSISKLKPSTATGPDGIPAILLKKCSVELLKPLHRIFNLSLESGVFPTVWKDAFMYPVHKKGDKRNVDNYRGISAINAVAKLFELVVLDPMFFHSKQYISDTQHGFMPKRSTTSNLLVFTSYVIDALAAGYQVDAVYTDLTAAFDRINHDIAIAKLRRLGFDGTFLQWLKSYLSNRKISVTIEQYASDAFLVPSGIPQGSHLGPLIFLLYFNDVNCMLSGPRLSFADDLKMYLRIENTADVTHLQSQLDMFARWCGLNGLAVNVSKCSVITFTRGKKPILADYSIDSQDIPRVDHIKDLGLILDPQLNYSLHTNYVVDKASRNLGFIFRMAKDFTDVYCLKSLYCALVRSTLEYASAVWCPFYQNSIDRIEAIQRRFVRFALRRLPWQNPWQLPSYESRCMLIDIDTLLTRRNVTRALIVSDMLTARIDCSALLEQVNLIARTRASRNNILLYSTFHRTNYAANMGVSGLFRNFNRLTQAFDFNVSRNMLKIRFRNACKNY